jgi:uncharacterized protein YaaQ
MKMVMAVVPRDEAECVLEALVAAGFTATFTESRGGMLRQAQYMLFIAVEKEALEQVLTIIQDSCHSQVCVEHSEPGEPSSLGRASVMTEVGGAAVFIWDLDRFRVY